MIKDASRFAVVGDLMDVPVDSIVVDHENNQRGIHNQSKVDASLRAVGWMYDRGTMRLIEKPWTGKEWADLIVRDKLDIPLGTPNPVPLRQVQHHEGANGRANIITDDLKWRRFVVDDGNHRAFSIQEMKRTNHKHAIDVIKRGCVLLDCDPLVQKDVMVFSSMAANNNLLVFEKDYLADKLGQLKKVRVFCFCRHCPWNHY